MSSKRSQWCEFDKEERKYIKKRDKDECYLCGAKGALQIMHIFVNRAHGGKGERRNGVLGCVQCHRFIDNPIGEAQIATSKELLNRCKKYLFDVEHITMSEQELCNELVFSRERDLPQMTVTIPATIPKIVERPEHRCEDCAFCVRNRRTNSTVPSYFCKRHYCLAKKSAPACAQFEERGTNDSGRYYTHDRRTKENTTRNLDKKRNYKAIQKRD